MSSEIFWVNNIFLYYLQLRLFVLVILLLPLPSSPSSSFYSSCSSYSSSISPSSSYFFLLLLCTFLFPPLFIVLYRTIIIYCRQFCLCLLPCFLFSPFNRVKMWPTLSGTDLRHSHNIYPCFTFNPPSSPTLENQGIELFMIYLK